MSAQLVRFPAYRQYEQLRVDASNALMGLLAGAQLSNHLLQLNRGSDRLLPEVYPNVPHIGRFNLTAEAASDILANADVHLGTMSIAYVLALHEDFLRTCLVMTADAGLISRRRARESTAATQHAMLESACGDTFEPLPLLQLGVLRKMRNAVIHNGGRVDAGLRREITRLSPDALDAWIKLARSNPRELREGDRLRLGHGEMLIALAVTKRIDRRANVLLQTGLPREHWVRVVVDDALKEHGAVRDRTTLLKKIVGVARHRYAALRIDITEISEVLGDRR